MLRRLVQAGMDVARLNMSHGSHEQHAEVVSHLRSISQELGKTVGILADLQGPKFRLGDLECGSYGLRNGQQFLLTASPKPGAIDEIPLPHPDLISACKPGQMLLLDDGRVRLEVERKTARGLLVSPQRGSVLSSRKGVSAPGVGMNLPSLTPKDVEDLRFALTQGVDWIAVSFVRRARDMDAARDIMQEMSIFRPLVAKIEKAEALADISNILDRTDGIMVARGDLGVETPLYDVPFEQKQLVRKCNVAGKPAIVATQMLESMITNPMPTRAEVADIATAIIDGADAVMLSGETAVGVNAVECVRVMKRVAENADSYMTPLGVDPIFGGTSAQAHVVARSAVQMAVDIRAKAILCATTSGSTARLIAKYRPNCPIYAITPAEQTLATLALTWGVRPLLIDPVSSTDEMMHASLKAVLEAGLLRDGQTVVLTAGVPVNVKGNTNLVRVHRIGDPL